MAERLSKLAEYLYNQNYEMAIQYYRENPSVKQSRESEYVSLLLAKAFFVNEDFKQADDLANRLVFSDSLRIRYEAMILLFKTKYLMEGMYFSMATLTNKLNAQLGQKNPYSVTIREIQGLVSNRSKINDNLMMRSRLANDERKEFQELLKAEDDNSIVMEGMPMFLVSMRWFQAWKDYVGTGERIQKQKKHPGPITQFQIVDHIFDYFHDPNPNKDYTNRYIFNNSRYIILPKKCWQFLKEKYGGIDVKRFNISFIDKPTEVITQVYLKKLEIFKYVKERFKEPNFVTVQITKKQNWDGLKKKLQGVWGPGIISEFQDDKIKAKVNDNQILQQVDAIGKKYVYSLTDAKTAAKTQPIQKCSNKDCKQTNKLKFCQCKSVKYCGMECLKADYKNHKKKCQLQRNHQQQQSVIFKNFNLDQKEFGGKKGIVGLKNLGNTCYMNSGLQCLSNTREITEYFMKEDFKTHINNSNPLGTKGNLACAYAELIREMWTGNSDVVSPFKLKKMIGNFASQFSGFGQQDSQQFISYLIDGLQQDLNLVKKKQTFETSDEVKSDEEMSRESELNFSKRVQSYIRNMMSGQFKSTVICGNCAKVSVCFDPYLLISLPIPTNNQWNFYFVPSNLSQCAINFQFEYNSTTILKTLSRQLSTKYNDKFQRGKQAREKIYEDRILFIIIDSDKFTILKVFSGNEFINQIRSKQLLFAIQLPITTKDQQLFLAEFQFSKQKFSYPRIFKLSKQINPTMKEKAICDTISRATPKGSKANYKDYVIDQKLYQLNGCPFTIMNIMFRKQQKLLTFIESYKEGFRGKINEMDDVELTLDDCLRNFTQKQKLEKQNSWYCAKCKDFKEAVKQMEIYKANKILVLAFKRFSRQRKIRTMVKYPLQNFNIGPYLLSNKTNQPIVYDLYGVVNHYGSLGGGHYTAFCQNFLNKRWYEFNDSRVSEINRKQIVTGDSYVLFYRRRDS